MFIPRLKSFLETVGRKHSWISPGEPTRIGLAMEKVLRFDGYEIVRLKNDHPEDKLKAGDCGLV